MPNTSILAGFVVVSKSLANFRLILKFSKLRSIASFFMANALRHTDFLKHIICHTDLFLLIIFNLAHGWSIVKNYQFQKYGIHGQTREIYRLMHR